LRIVNEFKRGKSLTQILPKALAREVDVFHLFFTLLMLDVFRPESRPEASISSPKVKEVSSPAPKAAGTPTSPAGESPFQILGVPESATDDQIRKAFEAKQKALTDPSPLNENARNLRKAYELIASLQGRRDYLGRALQRDGTLPAQAREIFSPTEVFNVAKKFFEKKDYDRAGRVFQTGMELFPDEGMMFCYLGYCRILSLLAKGEPDKKEFEKWKNVTIRGTQLASLEADAHYLMGRVFTLEKEYEKAMSAFRRAVSLKADYKIAASELRLLEMRAEKKKEASLIRWKT